MQGKKGWVMLVALTALLLVASSAGNYVSNWRVIASGGGSGESAHYRVNATIGQSLVASSQSDQYGLRSGFWPGIDTTYVRYLPVIFRR